MLLFAKCKYLPVLPWPATGAGMRQSDKPKHMLRMSKAMKITAILFLVACLQSMAAGYGQKVTLSEKDAKIEKVFKEIRRQTGFQFLYTTKMVENAKKVTIDVKNAELEEALNRCFEEQPFTYEIRNKTIILKSKPQVAKPVEQPKADPPLDIKGRLLNEKGEPIAGASVTVKGTLVRVLTNTNGEFSLVGVEDNAILYVSHVQYEDAVIPVNGNPQINATLVTRINSLDELQVIAYGTVTKRLNSGNVYTIKAKDLTKQPVTNPLQALQGRVPGLMIVQETGVPGGSYNVIIRGRNSVANGTDPLYVIDGVPYNSRLTPTNPPGAIGSESYNVSSNQSIGQNIPSPLNYINLNDIESIDVLKDADATAIYGSRGANGVILITTRRGKVGRAAIDINAYTGVAQVGHRMNFMNTDQWYDLRMKAFQTQGTTPSANLDHDVNGKWPTDRTVDWQDIFIGENADYTDAQASVSGGTADIQYILNGGYHKEGTVNPGSFKNTRGSLHFALNTSSPNKKLKTQLSASYLTSYNFLPFNDMMDAVRFYPIAPDLFDASGNLNWDNNSWQNPWQSLLRNSKARTENLLGNIDINYEILPGFIAKVTGGFSELQFNDIAKQPIKALRPSTPASLYVGTSDFSYNKSRSWIIEPQLQYRFNLSDAKFEVLLGSTIQNNKAEGYRLNATGYVDDDLLENLAGAATVTRSGVYNPEYRYQAAFARVKYNWQDKYLVHLTARRDGSSRFGPGKQFHNFGAAGAAWLFSNEEFVRNTLPVLSFGKIRASYGTTGSDQLGDYRFMSLYTSYNQGVTAPYQNSINYYPKNLYNEDLQWEVNKKAEIGLELGFAKDRFFLSASYFNNRSSNQLVQTALPLTTGFETFDINLPALVENTGYEFLFRTYNVKTKNFSWVSNFNFTLQKNKLLEYPGLDYLGPLFSQKYVIGQPLNVRRLYDLVGVDPNDGYYKFRSNTYGKDTTKPENSINDRYIIKNVDPKFFGGFQNTFTYKNFELDIFLQFVKQEQQNPLFINSSQPGYFNRQSSLNWPVELLDETIWSKPGDIATIQRLSPVQTGKENDAYLIAQNSRLGWVDASFIRIKNASFSYRLPQKMVKRMHLQNVRLYVQGQNLYTFTSYIGYDPETGMSAFPPLRVMTGGIQINL